METKEMNFFDLCCAIGRGIAKFIKWCAKTLGKMIRLSFRQRIAVLVVLGLCMGAALYYSREDNLIYQVVGIVQLNGVTPFIVTQTYNALGSANKHFPRQNVQSMLNIDSVMNENNFAFKAHDLIDMMADSTVDMIDWKDRIARNDSEQVHVDHMLALTFKTKHPGDVPQMQEAILCYLNSQPTYQLPYKVYEQQLQRTVQFHRDQVEKLDSLTGCYYFNNSFSTHLKLERYSEVVLGEQSIRLFLKDIYYEFHMQSLAEARYAVCTAPVTLLQPFTILKPINSPIKNIALALVLGWLLGLAIGWLIENRQALLAWLRK